MEKPENKLPPIHVIGHRHPDTDSVCAAIAYSTLKSKTDPSRVYEPCRAGILSRETEFVLDHFGVPEPTLYLDVSPQIRDTGFRRTKGISPESSLRQTWTAMQNEQVDTLCVTDDDNRLLGLITTRDMTRASMARADELILAKTQTSYKSIVETLEGTVVAGTAEGKTVIGRIVIGAGSTELIEKAISEGDVVIVSNRIDSQLSAIERRAGCIVVCTGAGVAHTIRMLAEECGCVIITTPYSTFDAGQMIVQAVPVSSYMVSKELLTFTPESRIEAVTKVMAKVRFRYFPVLDAEGHYLGMLSRRNLMNQRKKELILVDHNERSQAVDGLDEAEVLEIIDHHRICALITEAPVYFRNEPVGCTCTILYRMYLENDVEIDRVTAGLMLAAILSDTMTFHSPTCTRADVQAAKALAAIAGENITQFSEAMFEAGSDITGKTPDEILNTDYKIFGSGDVRFGISQNSFMAQKGRKACEKLVAPYLNDFMRKQSLDLLFCMFTDIPSSSSEVLMEGKNAQQLLEAAFGVKANDGVAELAGVVSRKKQMVPAILKALKDAEKENDTAEHR